MSHPGRSGSSMLRASCPCLRSKQVQVRRQTLWLGVLALEAMFSASSAGPIQHDKVS